MELLSVLGTLTLQVGEMSHTVELIEERRYTLIRMLRDSDVSRPKSGRFRAGFKTIIYGIYPFRDFGVVGRTKVEYRGMAKR